MLPEIDSKQITRFDGLWTKVVRPNIEHIDFGREWAFHARFGALTLPYCIEIQRAPNGASPAPTKCQTFYKHIAFWNFPVVFVVGEVWLFEL